MTLKQTMLRAVFFNTLIVSHRRILTEGWVRVWSTRLLRGLVLLSFTVQLALVFLGNRRKYQYRLWLRYFGLGSFLWVAYETANWATDFSLTTLSHFDAEQTDPKTKEKSLDPNYEIMAFWAPLFVLHFGSPDAITSYAMEDNELWLRKLFSLGRMIGLAIYVLISSWKGSKLNYLAIPMLVAGTIKSAERIWVQYMASSGQFRDSMLGEPDPGPNYAKFVDYYAAKESEGFEVKLTPLFGTSASTAAAANSSELVRIDDEDDVAILDRASSFFDAFKRLFANLILSFNDFKESRSFFLNQSHKVAFQVVDVELGFVYDLLYTKSVAINSPMKWLRVITLSLPVAVLCVFLIFCRHGYAKINVIITGSLLLGSILLELYQVILSLSSDWNKVWLSEQPKIISNTISFLRSWHLLPSKERWSNQMAQYNLLSFCFREKSAKRGRVRKFIHQKLENYRYESEEISEQLKELVFKLLKEKSESADGIKQCKTLCSRKRGLIETMRLLDKHRRREDEVEFDQHGSGDDVDDDVDEVEFDQCVLLLHIATDLCYYSEPNQDQSTEANLVESGNKCEMSKRLSDYMLYLLALRPSMLPDGIGLIRFRDTCAEAIEFLQEWKCIANVNEACKELLAVNTRKICPSEVKGDRSKSVLFDACRLATELRKLERKEKWETVCHVWIEMMSYAASHCQWQHHAKQLADGGELLTHVWLLMAHLGISEQFQISQGHGRVKLLAS